MTFDEERGQELKVCSGCMRCVLLPQLSSHQKAALSSNALIYHTRLETLENPGARDKARKKLLHFNESICKILLHTPWGPGIPTFELANRQTGKLKSTHICVALKSRLPTGRSFNKC